MAQTFWNPDGNGSTVVDGTQQSLTNTGASQINGTAANAKFLFSKGVDGRLGFRWLSGAGVISATRKTFSSSGTTFRFRGTVTLPNPLPSNASNNANLGTLRGSGTACRFTLTNTGQVRLDDAAALAANNLVLGTASPGDQVWVEVWGVVGSSTSNSAVHARAWNRNTGTALGVQLDSTVYNLGTAAIGSGDFGVFFAAAADSHEVGWTEILFEDGVASSFGGPPTGVNRTNDAEGLTAGNQITTSAGSAANGNSQLDLSALNGQPLYVDSAHPAHGTKGFRLDVAASGTGHLAMTLNNATYFRIRATKYIGMIPTTSTRYLTVPSSTSGHVMYGYITSTGKVRVDDNTGQQALSTGSVLVGNQVTWEAYGKVGTSTTTGVLHARVYKNNDPTGGILVADTALTATDTGLGTIANLLLGRGVGTSDIESMYWDDIAVETSTTAFTSFIGPASGGVSVLDGTFSGAVATATTLAKPGIFDASTVVTNTGNQAQASVIGVPGLFRSSSRVQGGVAALATALGVPGVFHSGGRWTGTAPATGASATALAVPGVFHSTSVGSIPGAVALATALAVPGTFRGSTAAQLKGVPATATALAVPGVFRAGQQFHGAVATVTASATPGAFFAGVKWTGASAQATAAGITGQFAAGSVFYGDSAQAAAVAIEGNFAILAAADRGLYVWDGNGWEDNALRVLGVWDGEQIIPIRILGAWDGTTVVQIRRG
jgi:hypothetical protein